MGRLGGRHGVAGRLAGPLFSPGNLSKPWSDGLHGHLTPSGVTFPVSQQNLATCLVRRVPPSSLMKPSTWFDSGLPELA